MTITYRNLKGAPLSADELDQNFRELQDRLEALEVSSSAQNLGGVTRIFQEGRDIAFENQAREIIGRLTLPQLQLRPRGAWAPQTEYAFYDVCLFEGKTYLCNSAHQSGEAFTDHASSWGVIFSTES